MLHFRSCCVFFCLASLASSAEVTDVKPGECVWKFVAPEGRNHNIVFPLIGNGRAFVVSHGPTRALQNWVYALDVKTGAVLWETDLGDVCAAEPALASDRMIVTATDRNLRFAKTFCLDIKDGKILWERHHGEWLTTPNLPCYRPVICGDQVMIVGWRSSAGIILPDTSRLICLELHDGYPVWSANDKNTGWFSRLSNSSGGRVYFGMTKVDANGHNASERIYSFAPKTGKLEEEEGTELGYKHYANYEPVVADGKLYVGDKDNRLSCFQLGGKADAIWTRSNADCVRAPAVQGGYVVATLASGDVACYRSSDGKELWKRYVGNFIETPVIQNNQVIVSSRQSVTALRLDTGLMLWEYYTPKAALDGRPCADAGIVLVPAAYTRENISLYALKIAATLPP